MWIVHPNRRGVVAWQSGNAVWLLQCRGGDEHIEFVDGRDETVYATFTADSLPVLDEQFVRGDELHLWYPQTDGEFGLRLAIRPIECSEHRLVVEVTPSIQTQLLDTHPTLDLIGHGDSESVDGPSGSHGPAISRAESSTHSVAVLLGPHDSPFTSDLSEGNQAGVQLRLFGEFLEKGVIRKARPWLAIDRSDQPFSEKELHTLWEQLAESPLPLTP